MTSTRTHLLFADSKNRDVALYPSGNSYVLHLTTPIKDIERVDLVSARVPNTVFNCTNGSNVLSISSSNVSINPGFYSVYGLAQALGITSPTGLGLDYLPDEGHFLFSSTTPFTIYIHSAELSKMLGLSRATTHTGALAGPTDPAYATKYILRSSTLVDMSLNEYIFLDIDELRTPSHVDTGALVNSTGTVSGSNANRNFAPVMMDVGSACIKNFHECKDYSVSVTYPEPIASLQRLTVRWVDKTGAPVNFRGWETNAFVLRLHIRDRESEEEQEDLKDMSRRLGELEIKRMLDEQAKPPPPPPPPKKTPFGKWTILVLLLLIALGYWGYKTFLRPNPVVPEMI
jgi:hypothetical protein